VVAPWKPAVVWKPRWVYWSIRKSYEAITVIWLEKISGGIWRRRLHHANPRILL